MKTKTIKTPLMTAERDALKKIFGLVPVYGFYCFSSADVFSCKATSDDGRAGAGACSQAPSHAVSTKARSAKTSAEGFFRFLYNF